MEVRSCHSSNDPPMAPRVKASLYNDLQALIGHDLPAFSPYILPFFPFLESVFPKTAASSHPLAASPMTPTPKTLFITANTPVFQTPSIPITFCFFSRHSFCYIMKLFSYIDCFLSTSLPPASPTPLECQLHEGGRIYVHCRNTVPSSQKGRPHICRMSE